MAASHNMAASHSKPLPQQVAGMAASHNMAASHVDLLQ
jgi:hypothetical protein